MTQNKNIYTKNKKNNQSDIEKHIIIESGELSSKNVKKTQEEKDARAKAKLDE